MCQARLSERVVPMYTIIGGNNWVELSGKQFHIKNLTLAI